ncbi:MAG: copper resistance CopC/CopD family protein [Solirubrobacteraceae bacterium]
MLRARRRPGALLGIVLVAGLLGGFAGAPEAGAHASLLETTPAPGAQLAAAPSHIALVYTEPLNARLTSMRLVEVGGGPVPATSRVTAARRLELRPRQRLTQGAYRLEWRSVSTIDGHIREGWVGFGVGTAAVGGAVGLQESPLDGLGPARAAIRWLFYAALFFFAGGLFNAILLGRGRPADGWLVPHDPRGRLAAGGVEAGDVAEAAARRTTLAGWLAAAGAVAVAAIETLEAGGDSWDGAREFLLSGNAGVSRLVLIGALLAAAAASRRRPTAAAAFAAVALVAISQGGHAAGVEPAAVAVASDSVHLVAGALWIGGIAQLTWTWLPSLRGGDSELRRTILQGVLARFGTVALPAFLVVAATGLLNAALQLGALEQLWTSGYGRLLAAKVLLVAVVAGLSYLHAFRLRPQLLAERASADPEAGVERIHRRLLAAEAPVGVAILAVAALLVGFPVPPRELREAQARAVVRPCDPCPFARPQPGEIAVAAPTGRLTAAAWLRRRANEVTGTLRVIDGKRRPAAVRATVVRASRQQPCGTGCWRFSLPRAGPVLELALEGDGDRRVVRLPARWDMNGEARSRRILARAQHSMRGLRMLRQVEIVKSAAAAGGTGGRAEFRFRAPDRMAYQTRGTQSVVIGDRTWVRPISATGWQALSRSEEEFRVRDAFRWTVFASTARLLDVRREGDRRVAEVALLDWGYPVWYRLTVDLKAGRVLRQSLVTPENRIEDRYFAFDRPLEIDTPG